MNDRFNNNIIINIRYLSYYWVLYTCTYIVYSVLDTMKENHAAEPDHKQH